MAESKKVKQGQMGCGTFLVISFVIGVVIFWYVEQNSPSGTSSVKAKGTDQVIQDKQYEDYISCTISMAVAVGNIRQKFPSWEYTEVFFNPDIEVYLYKIDDNRGTRTFFGCEPGGHGKVWILK
ncbi:MAG: hypothetical protein HAW61_02535 [Candidatus Portiera sp.]|nr:hypothetical protein [Portiera sp.]